MEDLKVSEQEAKVLEGDDEAMDTDGEANTSTEVLESVPASPKDPSLPIDELSKDGSVDPTGDDVGKHDEAVGGVPPVRISPR